MASSLSSSTSLLPSSLLPPKLQSFPTQLPKLASFPTTHFPRCSVSLAAAPSPSAQLLSRPSPAEVSRTIMELSRSGTLSNSTAEGWPLGIGARFVVDGDGQPALCLGEQSQLLAVENGKSTFHVRFEQSGSRTPQCTLLGSLSKPGDEYPLKKLHAKWEKKFGETVDENLVYLLSVERVLHLEDFEEDSVWVPSAEYTNAEPDPLRNFAEKIVDEMNSRHAEEVQRLCSIYLDTQFQVKDAKCIWVDRLGFDLHVCSEKEVFAARIPFPREVTDEKGVKSSFNSMSHLAWEIEKNYVNPDFEKIKSMKKVR